MNATDTLTAAHDTAVDILRIEPTPGREGEFRTVCLSDGSSAAWIPAALAGLGCGVARVTYDGHLLAWTPAS